MIWIVLALALLVSLCFTAGVMMGNNTPPELRRCNKLAYDCLGEARVLATQIAALNRLELRDPEFRKVIRLFCSELRWRVQTVTLLAAQYAGDFRAAKSLLEDSADVDLWIKNSARLADLFEDRVILSPELKDLPKILKQTKETLEYLSEKIHETMKETDKCRSKS